MSYTTFYHYTDSESLQKIQASGVIRKSAEGYDGSGVYLTTLQPTTMKGILAKNNYDGSAMEETNWVIQLYAAGKVDCFIELRLLTSTVRKVATDGRDVYLYQNYDLNLDILDQVSVGVVGGEVMVYPKRVQAQ